MTVVGVILAGGAARRMGGADKALLPLAGRPLVAHVAARLAPQVSRMALSANGDPARFALWLPQVPVLADPPQLQDAGPLAGLLAAMIWAKSEGASALVTVAVDTPFLPSDLVARLGEAAGSAGAACARSHGRVHYTSALRPVAGLAALQQALIAGERRLRFGLEAAVAVPFDGVFDPFHNLNTPEDLAAAEAFLAASAAPLRGSQA
jgi:molybdenum cofactor guanylyltransferase